MRLGLLLLATVLALPLPALAWDDAEPALVLMDGRRTSSPWSRSYRGAPRGEVQLGVLLSGAAQMLDNPGPLTSRSETYPNGDLMGLLEIRPIDSLVHFRFALGLAIGPSLDNDTGPGPVGVGARARALVGLDLGPVALRVGAMAASLALGTRQRLPLYSGGAQDYFVVSGGATAELALRIPEDRRFEVALGMDVGVAYWGPDTRGAFSRSYASTSSELRFYGAVSYLF